MNIISKCSCPLCTACYVLLLIGAVNWGLVGAFDLDVVAKVFGNMSTISRVVYVVIGLAGLLKIICCFKDCPKCCKKEGQ